MKHALMLAFLMASGALAQSPPITSIPVQNPSFETYNAPWQFSNATGSWNNGTAPGWTLTGVGGAGQQAPNTTAGSTGQQFSGMPDGTVCFRSNGPTISQDLGVPLQPYTAYNFTAFIAGNRLDGYGTGAIWTISLQAGGVFLNSKSGNTSNTPAGTWAQQNVTFTTGATPASGNLQISMGCNATQCNFDAVTVTSQPIPLTIVAPTLPTGVVGVPYSYQFDAVSGTPPYTWSVALGSPPAGLTFSNTGLLSGTPTTWGSTNFTIAVVDSSSTLPQRASLAVTVGANSRATLALTLSSTIQSTLPVTIVIGKTVTLNWIAGQPAPGEPGVTIAGYNVFRSSGNAYAPAQQINSGLVTSTAYKDQGLAPGTYFYMVTAVDSLGMQSMNSNQVQAVVQ